MSGEADVILVPKADMDAMRKASKQFEEALEKSSKQVSADTERELEKGVKKGIEKGSNGGFSIFSSKLKMAAAAVAFAAVSIVKDTMEKTLGGADQYVEEVKRRAETIKDIMGNAGAFGIDQGEYAALTLGAKSLGIEADDIRGLFEGFASALDSDEMGKYRKVSDEKGLDTAFYKLLNTASFMDPAKAQTWLATTAQLGDSDATFANKIAGVIRSMREDGDMINKQNLFNRMAGFDMSTGALSDSFDRTRIQTDKLNKNAAQNEYSTLLNGVTATQADSANRYDNKQLELVETHLRVIADKVTYANVIADAEILQVKAGAAALEELKGMVEGMVKLDHQTETITDTSNFFSAPSVDSAKNLLGSMDSTVVGIPMMLTIQAYKRTNEILDDIKSMLGTKASNDHSQAIADADIETGGD